jgi:hypothetical protein
LLQETLNEEGDTDHLLTEVAKRLNLEAMVGPDIESIRPGCFATQTNFTERWALRPFLTHP